MVVNSLQQLGLNASSREWTELSLPEPTHFVVDLLPGQTNVKGATMRLGNYTTSLISDKLVNIYGSSTITERHRHRYEVNNNYLDDIELSGLKISGWSSTSSSNKLVEIVEDPNHPFYIGCQFHPEFKSTYYKPHPLFIELLRASLLPH